MNADWGIMLQSVEKRRDVDARFYKPVCLLAVIDGIGDGSLIASDLDLDAVCDRFEAYLSGIFPERAAMGWRPFWHLCRDGAWIFSRAGVTVVPEDFRSQRKPNGRRELTNKFDRVAVPAANERYWTSADARAELRAAVIDMLNRDDAACRQVAAALADPASATNPGSGSAIAEIIAQEAESFDRDMTAVPRQSVKRQGFMASAAGRHAVELRAMEVVTAFLQGEGWIVEDVSLAASYDLRCRRAAEQLYVEVKGTTGDGERIILTRAEVAFAQEHRSEMLLAIVSRICLMQKTSQSWAAIGGTLRTIQGWAPASDHLEPITFWCDVPTSGEYGRKS